MLRQSALTVAAARGGGTGPGGTAVAGGSRRMDTINRTIRRPPGPDRFRFLREGTHARVGERLGIAIVRGDLAPGEVLPAEMQLCEMLGVSRTAMREAVRGLAAKGLVDSRPKRGTLVRDPVLWNHLDPDVLRWRIEVSDVDVYLARMFQLRQATEPEAAAIAAVAGTPEDHARLEADYRAMVDAGDDNAAWVEADLAFHRSIYLATRNEFFWPIGQLLGIGLRQMFEIAALGSHRPRAVEEHGDLCRAIVGRRPEKARAVARRMVDNASGDIDRILRAS